VSKRAALKHYKALHKGVYQGHYSDLISGEKASPGEPWSAWASHVEPQPVAWLWRGRIPFGKLTILDGDPGLGKSTLMLDVAARLSTGRAMPHDRPDGPAIPPAGPSPVVLLSAEDGVADTIRPRLEAASAQLNRVFVFSRMPAEIYNGPFRIPEHLYFLQALVERLQARLVILDPLVAYLGRGINANSDQDVRSALHPLAYQAERSGVAVVVVRHLSKQHASGNPLYRGGGSIGLIGAARSGLLAAPDPDDPTQKRRVLASTKCNVGPLPPALVYRLVSAPSGVAAVAWEGLSGHTAADLLAYGEESRGGAALAAAKAILSAVLADGPVPATVVQRHVRQAGLSSSLVWRAKTALRVSSQKIGGRGSSQSWVWALPVRDARPDDEAPPGR